MEERTNLLLKTLEDQACFGFTGKINLINNSNFQLVGNVLMKDGLVVNANYRGGSGINSVLNSLVDIQVNSALLKFVIEPEIISENHLLFRCSVDEIKKNFSDFLNEAIEAKKLKPHDDLRLLLNDTFLIKGENVSSHEFDIMKTLTTYNRVGEIYKASKLQEHEVTTGLVSLRKKGALKVYK